jgi:hypothetical protein
MLQITKSDVSFYLGTVVTVIGLFTVLWKATAGAMLKRMQDNSVTKLDLANKLGELKDFLRNEFISRREYEAGRKGDK